MKKVKYVLLLLFVVTYGCREPFDFTYEVELPELTENAKMWLPVAQSDDYQNIQLVSIPSFGVGALYLWLEFVYKLVLLIDL